LCRNSKEFAAIARLTPWYLLWWAATRLEQFWVSGSTSITEAFGLARKLRASATQEERETTMAMTMTEWQRTCETLNRIQRIGCTEEQVTKVARKCFLDAKREEEREARRVART
jgi:hypothetical protein